MLRGCGLVSQETNPFPDKILKGHDVVARAGHGGTAA